MLGLFSGLLLLLFLLFLLFGREESSVTSTGSLGSRAGDRKAPKLLAGPFLRGGPGWLSISCRLDRRARVAFELEKSPKEENWPDYKEAESKAPKVILRGDSLERRQAKTFVTAVHYRGKLLGRCRGGDRAKRVISLEEEEDTLRTHPFFHEGWVMVSDSKANLSASPLFFEQQKSFHGHFTLSDSGSFR